MSPRRRSRRPAPRRVDGHRIGTIDAPEEGSDAGPDHDLRARYRARQIHDNRGVALRRFANAQRLASEDRSLAEHEARAAIRAVVRAYWWAEDSTDDEPQHRLLHEIGSWTRRSFGCSLDFDGTKYRQTCPIAIAHKRIGLSIGFIARRMCSICGGDLSSCPHVRGRSYWVRGGANDGLDCPVCLTIRCNHRHDRLYRASVVSIVDEVDELKEISFVGRPASPEARLTELPVDTSSLQRRLGPSFQVGVDVSCDLCRRGECWGFDELATPEVKR